MIGSSSGQAYDSEMDVALGRPITASGRPLEASEKPAGESSDVPGTQLAINLDKLPPVPANDNLKPEMQEYIRKLLTPKGPPDLKLIPGGKYFDSKDIDRDHHVPLVASALTDDDGKMYGMAIDSRIPPRPEYEKHLWDHEAYENDYMNNLVKIGYNSQDAYHKAHDWSTQRESAAVEAEFGKEGLEDYKQHWRDAASIASEPSSLLRHPDAHTTKHGLDESELGKTFGTAEQLKPELRLKEQEKLNQARDTVEALKEPFAQVGRLLTGTSENVGADAAGAMSNLITPEKLAPAVFAGMGAKTADTFALRQALDLERDGATNNKIRLLTGWFRGADNKQRFEIPDYSSKLTIDKANEALAKSPKQAPFTHLENLLDHPELYKAYPDLRKIEVQIDNRLPVDNASFTSGVNLITIGPHSSNEELKKTLLHEVQHAIQWKEDFTYGSTTNKMKPYVMKAMAQAGIKNPMVKGKSVVKTKADIDYINSLLATAFDAYRHVGGEVEARNVSYRSDFTPEQLKYLSPERTQDYPNDKLLNAPP